MKIDYVKLAKELTGSSDIDELIIAAKKLEEYDVSDISGNIETFNLVDFAKNLKIRHYKYGTVPFKPYDFQKSTLKSIEENQYVLIYSARQMGLTSMLCMAALWEAVSKSDQMIVLCSSKYVQVLEMFNRIYQFHNILSDNPVQILDSIKNVRNFYDQLLSSITITERTKSQISFSNGSKIIGRAASSNAGRGLNVDTLIVDDASYIAHSISNDFWDAMRPCVAMRDGKIILASTAGTANGLFYELWTDSKNPFVKIELPYSLHPERDNKWVEEYKQRISEDKFAAEFECKFMKP